MVMIWGRAFLTVLRQRMVRSLYPCTRRAVMKSAPVTSSTADRVDLGDDGERSGRGDECRQDEMVRITEPAVAGQRVHLASRKPPEADGEQVDDHHAEEIRGDADEKRVPAVVSRSPILLRRTAP